MQDYDIANSGRYATINKPWAISTAQSQKKEGYTYAVYCCYHFKALSDEQKDELKKAIGQKISLIPGKTEAALMVDISDNHTMYFAGEKRKLAYVDVRCYGSTEFENKKALTEALFDAVGCTPVCTMTAFT